MTINTLKAAENIFRRYEENHKVVHAYYGLLAYYALAQVADADQNDELIKKCRDYLNLYPDKIDHPHYNFEVYRVGGPAKAWLLFNGYMPEAKDGIREYAEITMNSPHSKEGIICHPEMHEKIWVDTVAFVTPFMLYAGLALDEEKYIDYAVDLCFKTYDLLIDKTNGLIHQTKGFLDDPERVSADFWGRGNGWGYVGLTELIQHLPENSVHRAKALEYYKKHTNALLEYQSERGLWRQIINEELAWYECTGTALILYGIGVGIRCGILNDEKYVEAFRKGIEALGKYCITTEFMTCLSCPGCLCPGEGADKGTVKAYLTEKVPEEDEVHSYGCIMLALVEAYKNGIKDVDLFELIRE